MRGDEVEQVTDFGIRMIFIEGQETKIPLEQLITKGRELIASGYPQTTTSFDQEMNEAATAVHWYDEQHRAWVEVQGSKQPFSGQDNEQPRNRSTNKSSAFRDEPLLQSLAL